MAWPLLTHPQGPQLPPAPALHILPPRAPDSKLFPCSVLLGRSTRELVGQAPAARSLHVVSAGPWPSLGRSRRESRGSEGQRVAQAYGWEETLAAVLPRGDRWAQLLAGS